MSEEQERINYQPIVARRDRQDSVVIDSPLISLSGYL